MNEKVTVHGSPDKSVFGLVGADVISDEDKFYIKIANDTRNTGWKEIPPTPTVTPTITVTPSKTPIVTRQIVPTVTPTITKTPTITPTVSPSSPLVTPTPTSTRDKTFYNYLITTDGPGTANRIDGPNSGIINVGVSTMQLQAQPNENATFERWDAPEGVILSDIYSLNPVASGFFVFNDVVITAVFSSTPSLPGYTIYGVVGGDGRLDIDIIGTDGSSNNIFYDGYAPGTIILNAGCANQIVNVWHGYAELITSQGC